MKALHESLVALAEAYGRFKGVRLWRVGHLAAGRGAFFVDLRSGRRQCQTGTYERVVQWFSDHWPEDLEWPSDISRPAPNPDRKETA